MTIQEFNALPLEVRRSIENHAGCLSCGNAESKLTKAYELYLTNRKMAAYVLRGGGICYRISDDEKGALYNIKPTDTPLEIRDKIRVAKLVHEVSPNSFTSFNEIVMAEILEGLPEEVVIDLSEQLAAEQLAAEQLAAEQLAAEQLAAEQLAAEQLAAEQLAAEQLAAETKKPQAKKVGKTELGAEDSLL